MGLIPVEKLVELQHFPEMIRNICILAHVDHGKTTLADALIAANGIISSRLAGTLRYLDSRPDEQERGITMKTSAISLFFVLEKPFLINLMDSPGHVDFGGEVTTALRLCDGALIVVDVVEGLCPQTTSVLRQAWKERIKPVLVLNKIDRLVLELKMTSAQAYRRLQAVLEEVNAVAGELFLSEAMHQHEQCDSWTRATEEAASDASLDSDAIVDEMELLEQKHVYFAPESGNVVFASSIDNWGFRLSDFAQIYSRRIAGLKEAVLKQTLWGDFYLDAKLKRIRRGAALKNKKPLFVQLVLDNIWSAYEAVILKRDSELLDKIVRSLSIELKARDIRQLQSDPRCYLKTIMGQWIPLAGAVLTAVCTELPSPKSMAEDRIEHLLGFADEKPESETLESLKHLKADFLDCNSGADAPVVAFVSKMFPYERSLLSQQRSGIVSAKRTHANSEIGSALGVVSFKDNALPAESNGLTEVFSYDPQEPIKATPTTGAYEFLAFARVFSGTIRMGQKLFVLPPTHNPTLALSDSSYAATIATFTVERLYLMMGRELEAVAEVPAGNIFAIAGLEHLLLKSGVISSTLACPPFDSLSTAAEPIVRVALEPKNSSDLPLLVRGLQLLDMADPCVRTLLQDSGEQILVTAGEVHLQRCLNDLRERFANIELVVSEPIIPFQETIISLPSSSTGNSDAFVSDQDVSSQFQGKSITIKSANKMQSFQIKAVPLPSEVCAVLEKHEETLKLIERNLRRETDLVSAADDIVEGQADALSRPVGYGLEALKESVAAFEKDLNDCLGNISKSREYAETIWAVGSGICSKHFWCFGPRKARLNALLNRIPDYGDRPSVFEVYNNETFAATKHRLREYDQSVTNGFQLRCGQGPLCEEPIRGVAFVVEQWSISAPLPSETLSSKADAYGPMSGQIMAAVKEGCKRAFQRQPQRLVLAMYNCVVQATAEILGKVYAVLAKRCGRVVGEDMSESSNIFQVTAVLPVVESFGFAEEFRKRTSGLASPQLVFSHWEVLDVDPFWVPRTEEELEHFGEKADSENRARKYMNSIRKRKGLMTDEKIVESAEKQRTLTKMK